MFKLNKSEAPQRARKGLVSHILLQQGDVQNDRLAVTWVDVAPGSGQQPHSHGPEQAYVIIKGRGLMRVDNEEKEVAEGDFIYIPPNQVHSIINRSDELLTYISASTPAFDLTAIYDTGELRTETDTAS